MKRSTRLTLLAFIMLAAVALRSYQLLDRSIWFDEAFTWRLLQFSWSDMWQSIIQDVHPPLYYLLLKPWTLVFGSSLLAMRSFSITVAGLLIVAVYGLARSATRQTGLALTAALFVALAPWHIALSTEARMYTLAALLALLMVWALLKAVAARPRRRGWWLVFAATATALAYTHYYGLFVIMGVILWLLGYFLITTRGRLVEIVTARHFWWAVAALLLIAVAYLPWLPVFVRQARQVNQSFWIPPLAGWTIPDTLYHMLFGGAINPDHHSPLGLAVSILPTLLLVVVSSWLMLRPWHRPASSLLLAAFILPFAISAAVSLLNQSVYQDRYFLPGFSMLMILLALSIFSIRSTPWRTLAVTGMAVFFLFSWYRNQQHLALPAHPGIRGAVAHVAHSASSEPVIVGSSFIFFSVLHYQHEEFPALPVPQLYTESPNLSHFSGGPILRLDDIIGPEVFTASATSLWVIDTSGFGGSNISVPADWVKSETDATFPEVFPYQGDIFVKHYKRVR